MTTQTFHHTAMAQLDANAYAGLDWARQRKARAVLRTRMMAGNPVRSDAELRALVGVTIGQLAH